MDPSLLRRISQLSTIEKRQQSGMAFIMDIPQSGILRLNNEIELINDYFFKHKDIFINRHNRFADYPAHKHEFVELNYMLKGSCQQVVDGHTLTLHEGELLLLDVGCTHSLKACGENDLLMNIVFKNQAINIDWLTTMHKKSSPAFKFLLNASGKTSSNHTKYLHFESSHITHIQFVLARIIHEYYLETDYSTRVIHMYLPILFTELIRKCDTMLSQSLTKELSVHDELMLSILKLIENDYQTLTLQQLALKIGYNTNYTGNLIKKITGKTFTQLLNERRLQVAHQLISSTDLPINTIIESIGCSNKTYFYKIYKAMYLQYPSHARKTHQSNMSFTCSSH